MELTLFVFFLWFSTQCEGQPVERVASRSLLPQCGSYGITQKSSRQQQAIVRIASREYP